MRPRGLFGNPWARAIVVMYEVVKLTRNQTSSLTPHPINPNLIVSKTTKPHFSYRSLCTHETIYEDSRSLVHFVAISFHGWPSSASHK